MPLPDYQERVERMQRAMARAVADDPLTFNLPGKSVACKVDPLYYLAVQPLFDEAVARWGGMLPATVADALVRTGMYISRVQDREYIFPLRVCYQGKYLEIKGTFVDADFIDRALKMFAGAPHGLECVDLRIAAESRNLVESLFEHKTAPSKSAFME